MIIGRLTMQFSLLWQKQAGLCFYLLITALLVGCESPSSTNNLESDRFSFYAYVHYYPATAEGIVSIDIEYDAFLSSPTSLSLGNGDAIIVSSGENSIAITGGELSTPIIIDPSSELSVDFQRNSESLKKITANVNAGLFPSVESDVTSLNASAKQLNASLDFGIPLPYEIEPGFRFGYGSMPVRCYGAEPGLEEIGDQSLLTGQYSSAEMYITSLLDANTVNPQIDANRLIATQYQNLLTSEFYEYCETQLYSVVHIARPFNSDTSDQTYTASYASYSEEGDLDGDLFIRLVSEPVELLINRTSLGN